MTYLLHVTETRQWPSGGLINTWTHRGAGIDWEAARDERVARWRRWDTPYTRHGDTYTVVNAYDDETTTTELTWEPA